MQTYSLSLSFSISSLLDRPALLSFPLSKNPFMVLFIVTCTPLSSLRSTVQNSDFFSFLFFFLSLSSLPSLHFSPLLFPSLPVHKFIYKYYIPQPPPFAALLLYTHYSFTDTQFKKQPKRQPTREKQTAHLPSPAQ